MAQIVLIVRKLISKINFLIRNYIFRPNVKVISTKNKSLCRLGTMYGGWTYFDTEKLYKSTMVSAGAGEDISFDLEFCSKYKAHALIVDPTPRAIFHVDSALKRVGEKSESRYLGGGKERVESYDLEKIFKDQLILIPKALWKESIVLKFYEPTNSSHVSHSIVNQQREYDLTDDRYITVDATTLDTILLEYKLTEIDILKLDIEGAEIDVLKHMLKQTLIRPSQLLIEFDGLNMPSKRAKNDYEEVNKLLVHYGYQCYYFDGRANFLYAQSKKLGL